MTEEQKKEIMALFDSHPWIVLRKGSQKKAEQFRMRVLKTLDMVPEHPQTIIDNESMFDSMIHELSFDGDDFEAATEKIREGQGMLQEAIRKRWPGIDWPNF